MCNNKKEVRKEDKRGRREGARGKKVRGKDRKAGRKAGMDRKLEGRKKVGREGREKAENTGIEEF